MLPSSIHSTRFYVLKYTTLHLAMYMNICIETIEEYETKSGVNSKEPPPTNGI